MGAFLRFFDVEGVAIAKREAGRRGRGRDVVGDGMPAQHFGSHRGVIGEPFSRRVVLLGEIGEDGA
ncbi:hypothetical protein D3C86_2127480 [compost metagenome]